MAAPAAGTDHSGGGLRAVVLVEGASDRTALEVLAARRGQDLAAEGVRVVAMGGATNVGHFLVRYGSPDRSLQVSGMCDAAEEPVFRRAWQRAGLDRYDVFVCEADLEDELIRSLGAADVERVIDEQGERGRFRTFQGQPAQRGRSHEQQLHRFLGTRSGRKAQYAAALVQALDLARVPPPLDGVLTLGPGTVRRQGGA